MAVTTVMDNITEKLVRASGSPTQALWVMQALHRPNSVYDAQRDQDDMIRAMDKRSYTNADVVRELNKWQEAVEYMRVHDAARVRNFTNLKSPFPKAS